MGIDGVHVDIIGMEIDVVDASREFCANTRGL